MQVESNQIFKLEDGTEKTRYELKPGDKVVTPLPDPDSATPKQILIHGGGSVHFLSDGTVSCIASCPVPCTGISRRTEVEARKPITVKGREIHFRPIPNSQEFCSYEVYDDSRLSLIGDGSGQYIGIVTMHYPSKKWDATWNMTRSDPNEYFHDGIEEAVEHLLRRAS